MIVFNVQEFLNSAQMTEAGPLDLIDHSDDENDGKHLSLPGVRKGKDFFSQTAIHFVSYLLLLIGL